MCINCGKFVPKEGEKEKENVVSSEKCPSCGEAVKNSECQKCGSEKLSDGTFVYPKKEEKKEEKKKVERAIKAGWDKVYYYICECGEKVSVGKDVEVSWWDGLEWLICPNCGNRREKDVFLESMKGV